MSSKYGNQQDVDELVAHYNAINAANEANKTYGNLAPQDKVAVWITQNPSPYLCCPQPAAPIVPPGGPILLAVISGSAILFWNYTDDGQDGFNLEKSLDGLTYNPYVTLAYPSLRLYTDANVSESYTYWYRLNAYNSGGTSSWSNTASIYFPITPPVGPITLSVSSASAMLSWSFTHDRETGWNVEKSLDGIAFANIAILPTASLRNYEDHNVTESFTYWYQINAYNTSGTSSYSNIASIHFTLSPPMGPISLSLASGSADLSWSFVDDTQDGFHVERSTTGITYSLLTTLPTASLRWYPDTTVTYGNTYWYRIDAYNASGSSPYSNTASINFPTPVPWGPISLSLSSGSAVLDWTYTDTTQDGFNVFRSVDGLTYTTYSNVPTSSARTYTDIFVTASSVYWYAVEAYNSSGSTAQSNTASIYFPYPPPAGPISLSVSSGSAILSWLDYDTASFRSGYNVFKSTDGLAYTTYSNIANPSASTFNDTDVSESFTYWYMVNSYNGSGSSPVSNTASILFPLSPPEGPISLSVASGSADLTWSFTDDLQDGFNIEKSTDSGSFVFLAQWANKYWIDNGVVTGSNYSYRVNAYNSAGTSSWSNTASITFAGGGPPPTPPEAPLFLQVFSGSAILIWETGSGAPAVDRWDIFKSITGPSGSFSQIGTSPADTLTYHDLAVNQNQRYDYKVVGINAGGTGSFSNVADIAIIACTGSAFEPIVYSGHLPYSSGSTYRNTYGLLLPFTTSVSQSISVWGRSADFDVYLTLVDANGNILIENDWDGWAPSGDKSGFGANAAFHYVCPSGSYQIEISSVDNNVGRYMLYISPGSQLEATWSNSNETATCEWIPSSNCVVVGEQGPNIVWHYVDQQSSSVRTYSQGVQGVCYSPIQDKVYAWVYYGNGTIGWTASIDIFDNTGSLVSQSLWPRPLTVTAGGSQVSQVGGELYLVNGGGTITDFTAYPTGSSVYVYTPGYSTTVLNVINSTTMSVSVTQSAQYSNFQISPAPPRGTPNPDLGGYLTYDPKHDRIAFYEYFYATNHEFNIYDIATDTFVAGLNAAPYTNFEDMWEGSYSWADDSFYIGVTALRPLVKVNATTFAITASNAAIQSNVISSYASSSGLLMLRSGGSGGKVVFADPVAEVVVHTQSDLPSSGYFEGTGKSGDPMDDCTNAYIITIDPNTGVNVPALALLDKNTYLPQNYLALNSDIPSGFAPQGWFQYSIAFNYSNSRVYSAQVEYNNNEGRLYSIRPTRAPFAEYLPPYTSSASDTASCLIFKTEFPISESMDTRVMAGYVTATRYTSSVANYLVASDNELNDLFNGQHNFNNCFLSSSGQFIQNYTSSYIHTYSGKNAVYANEKFYMLSDELTEQSATWEPVSGSKMLVFDRTGSLKTTIQLTYGARDWDTDGYDVFVYEMSGSRLFVQRIDVTTDTVAATNELQVGYVTVPGFAFTYGTSSLSASTNAPIGLKNYPYFGRIVVILDKNDTTYTYYNDIYGTKVGVAPAPYTFLDTGSGDRIWAGGSTGYALYNYATKLDMSTGSYKQWLGSATYCPITDHMYWGAYDYNDNPILIETDKNLNVSRTHSLQRDPDCLKWNQRDRTIEIYQTSGFYGYMQVFDPVAKTVVCRFATLLSGSYGGGHMGWNFDTDARNGDVYVPQRYDAASQTGSIQIYRM